MAKEITDEDLELLGELGVEAEAAPSGGRSAREQRIIAGFEEIERFVREQGRLPEHAEGTETGLLMLWKLSLFGRTLFLR